MIKVNVNEDKEKKENIYSMICPEERLVLRRIIKVKGRIKWLKISIKGRISIKPTGDP